MISCVKVEIRCDMPGCKTAWDVVGKPNVYSFSNLPNGERGIKICSKCLREMANALEKAEPKPQKKETVAKDNKTATNKKR